MKKIKKLFITLITISFCSTISAQEATTVTESIEEIGEENGVVLQTRINRAETKDILKEWKKLMKDYDGDVDIKKNTVKATEVKIESIDPNEIEVIAEVKELSKNTRQFSAMFIKNLTPISSANDISAFTAAKNIVRNFANKMSNEATKNYNEVQLKIFGDINDDLEDAKKEEEKAEEDIKDAKEEIKKAEETIKDRSKELQENRKKQEELQKKLNEQKRTVNEAKKEMELFK